MSPLTRFGCLIAAAVIVLDQATKWWILEGVMQPPRIIPVTPFFNLLLTWNTGVSFGLFNNSNSLNALLLSVLAIVIVVFLFFWLRRAEHKRMAAGLGLIIGGALGNVIDRGLHGAVVDFLDFYIDTLHWPAFNLADSAITVGVLMLVGESLFQHRKSPKYQGK